MTPQIKEKGQGSYDKTGRGIVDRKKRPANEAKLGPKPEGGVPEAEAPPATEMQATDILAQMDAERKRKMEEKGLAPFLPVEEGETPFRVLPKMLPRLTTNQFGHEQLLLRVVSGKDQQEYDLAVSTNSPVARKLLTQIAAKNYGPFTLCRSGSGQKDTRYSLKGL
jgi:hypothetical protein